MPKWRLSQTAGHASPILPRATAGSAHVLRGRHVLCTAGRHMHMHMSHVTCNMHMHMCMCMCMCMYCGVGMYMYCRGLYCMVGPCGCDEARCLVEMPTGDA